MAVLDILATYNADVFLDTDPGWRQFISDHKDYIIANSIQRQPSGELMTEVGQDLTWYLRRIGVTRPIAWIVGYINDLDCDLLFTGTPTLYVPDITLINTLYLSYKTTSVVKTG